MDAILRSDQDVTGLGMGGIELGWAEESITLILENHWYNVNMPGIILTGSLTERDHFINNFVKEHDIASFNILRFDAQLKIEEARSLIHYVSFKTTRGQQRLVLVTGGATIEAQNALLKTIEELDDDVFVLFSIVSDSDLLPTIVSRCMIRTFSVDVPEVSERNDDFLELINKYLLTGDFSIIFQIGEYFEKKEGMNYEEMVLLLRKMMLNTVKSNSSLAKINRILPLLHSLLLYYPLLKNNNFNQRMVVENVLLTSNLFSD